MVSNISRDIFRNENRKPVNVANADIDIAEFGKQHGAGVVIEMGDVKPGRKGGFHLSAEFAFHRLAARALSRHSRQWQKEALLIGEPRRTQRRRKRAPLVSPHFACERQVHTDVE